MSPTDSCVWSPDGCYGVYGALQTCSLSGRSGLLVCVGGSLKLTIYFQLQSQLSDSCLPPCEEALASGSCCHKQLMSYYTFPTTEDIESEQTFSWAVSTRHFDTGMRNEINCPHVDMQTHPLSLHLSHSHSMKGFQADDNLEDWRQKLGPWGYLQWSDGGVCHELTEQ